MVLAIFILIGFVCVSASGAKLWFMWRDNNRQVQAAAKQRQLESEFSWPARQILNEYSALPEANRPSFDIKATLKALDKKYDMYNVNNHFTIINRYSYMNPTHKTWNCACIYDDYEGTFIGAVCDHYPEYRKMFVSIQDVADALKEQQAAIERREYQMMLAGIENDLRSVEEITEALRNEKQIIESTTKEIV